MNRIHLWLERSRRSHLDIFQWLPKETRRSSEGRVNVGIIQNDDKEDDDKKDDDIEDDDKKDDDLEDEKLVRVQ